MRITQNMIYDQATRNMNSLLTDIMRYNEQYASQKKVNRPSDDPGGMARSLDLRSELASLEQYEENIDTAEGWLELADAEIQEASDMVTRLIELAEQAATGTLDADQRGIIAQEARELMEQLVNVANTEYAGDAIFGGTVLDGETFVMGLGATVQNASNAGASNAGLNVLSVAGASNATVYLEFLDDGEVGTDELGYRWSDDGGDTWRTGTLEAGETLIDLGAVQMALEEGSTVTATPESDGAGSATGTAVWIRPAVYYQGDGADSVEVVQYGDSPVTATAMGDFETGIVIRLDEDSSLASGVSYSYSLDNGATWVEGNETSNATFAVPGGFVELSSNGGTSLSGGDEFLVRPYNAAINVSVGSTTSLQINNIGTDIFGGLYTPAGSDSSVAALEDTPESNLFEVVGTFVGYLETNNMEGVSECLENFGDVQANLSTALGEIGGRMVRLEFAQAGVTQAADTITSNVSSIEDADVTAVSTALAQAQSVYEAVLSTSAQIMSLSLANYL